MSRRLYLWSMFAALSLASFLSGCVYGGYRHDDRDRAWHEEHEEHEHGGDNY